MSAVDEIKARLDIVDVVSEYVPLSKSGRNFKGLCPFHTEKTPSFFVFPESGTWHCFGACHSGGDAFTFVMKQESLDFSEALSLLAAKAGVQLESPQRGDRAEREHLDRLLEVNAAAAKHFHDLLVHSPLGSIARAYAAERGLNQETIQAFQLGFAPDDWRILGDALLMRGYQREDLMEAGLIIARDDGGYYDRFRGRFMIPIRDIRGRVIAFGGRILGEGQPKYLNSPQTPLFNKSRVLFGLDMAKGAIRAKGQVVIVEGYMDVLQAYQAEFANVVATMGIALTEQQLSLLKRMTKRYILALDPDLAGDQGTLRGLATARHTLDRQTVPVPTASGWIRYESRLDADIRIMSLPAGQDPDNLIRANPQSWEPLVEAAVPVVDYYLQVISKDIDPTSAKGKSELVSRMAPILREIRDEVERTHYVQKLARVIRVDEAVVRRRVAASRTAKSRQRAEHAEQGDAESSQGLGGPISLPFSLEEHCLATLLRRPQYLERVSALLESLALAPLQEDDFDRIENRTLFVAWLEAGEESDWQEWVEGLSPALRQHLDFLLARGPDANVLAAEDADLDIERCVLRLRYRNLERVSNNLQLLYAEALEQGNARAAEFDQTPMEVTKDRLRVEQALLQRSSLGRREEKERTI